MNSHLLRSLSYFSTLIIIKCASDIPLHLDHVEPRPVLLLSHGLVMRSEVPVPSVLLRQEMTALGIRVVHEGIIHVLVVGPNALLEAHLLDPISILQASL